MLLPIGHISAGFADKKYQVSFNNFCMLMHNIIGDKESLCTTQDLSDNTNFKT